MKKSIPLQRFILRSMQLTLTQLLIASLFCGISLAHTLRGQEILTREISLQMESVEVSKILNQLEKQARVKFIYSTHSIQLRQKASLNVHNRPLFSVLDELFRPLQVQYEVMGSRILLRRKAIERQSSGLKITFPDRNVRGVVTDEKGEGLPGVSILLKGTQQGTTTDGEGVFSIDVPNGDAVLVFSFVGYKSQEVVVGNSTTVDIELRIDEKALDEVIVVGYGVQKKVNMTGAVDVISNKQLENRQASTVSQILQGQSPGLDISAGNRGYEPGASMNINIRGMGSLNGGSPFVLIDGFPGDMDRLNPSDIESISVLKDAAASAIYGARAPYGVILITTKSGKKDEKLTISYSGNTYLSKPARLPSMLDSYTFARVVNEMGGNAGGKPYSEAAIDRIIAFQNKDWSYLKQFYPGDATHFEAMPLSNGRWGANENAHANYDWYDEYYGHSINQQHTLSARGGSAKIAYYLSAGFAGQEGVLNFGTDYYKRYNLAGKISTSLTNWLDIRYETRFAKSPREFVSILPNWDYNMVFRQIARTVPTQAMYGGYGTYTLQSKIPFINDSGTNKHETTENWHTISAELRPLKSWKINGEFAYRNINVLGSEVYLSYYEQLVDKSYIPDAQSVPNSLLQNQYNSSYLTTNLYTSYDFSIKKHNIYAMLGTQLELDQSRNTNITKTTLIVPSVPSLQTALGDAVVVESLQHWATLGYFGRLTYNLNGKYLFEANARYDGTSRFQQSSRWGFFPSFSAGWNVDQEGFWKGIKQHVNTLKFRASWGQLGNQQVASYQDLALIPLQTGLLDWLFKYGEARPVGYTSAPRLVSPNLRWETAISKNIGLNASFFQRRLQWDADLFERVTENMIGPSEPVPGIMGSEVPQSNNATLRTRGWETSLKWSDEIGKSGASYFINLNIYDARSFVMKYLNPSGIITDWYSGKEVGEIWGYTAHDLFKSQEEVNSYLATTDMSFIHGRWNPGDLKYLDTNGDGKVNNGTNALSNHGDLSVIGNESPRYQYGLGLGASYLGFDLSLLIRGIGKRDYSVQPGGENYVFWGIRNWLFTALTPDHLNYFRDNPGDKYNGLHEGEANINLDSYWPKPYLDQAQNNKNRLPSTRYLLNASYLRLQNVQLGYNFSPNVLDKIRLQKLRIFVSGENLFTITSLIRGLDPSAMGPQSRLGMTYGVDKMFSVGINATL